MLSVALREGIDIPHLCYEESLSPYGACRLCMVDVVTCGKTEMVTSCTLKARNGLEILTDSPEIIKYRSILFELYLSEAPKSVILKDLAAEYGVTKTRFLKKMVHDDPLGVKCILCGLCVRVCNEVMGAEAINFINRGPYTVINTPFFEESSTCLGCGSCASVCPTDAIRIEDSGPFRIMRSWSGTKVPLISCSKCGTCYAPKELFEKIKKQIDPPVQDELMNLCPKCRRDMVSEGLFLAKSGGTSLNV